MSLTLELLRTETDREPFFWPSPFNASENGLISAVPHDCPKAKKAAPTATAPNADAVNNNNARNGLSPDSKRHSYCKYSRYWVRNGSERDEMSNLTVGWNCQKLAKSVKNVQKWGKRPKLSKMKNMWVNLSKKAKLSKWLKLSKSLTNCAQICCKWG